MKISCISFLVFIPAETKTTLQVELVTGCFECRNATAVNFANLVAWWAVVSGSDQKPEQEEDQKLEYEHQKPEEEEDQKLEYEHQKPEEEVDQKLEKDDGRTSVLLITSQTQRMVVPFNQIEFIVKVRS